MTVEHKHFFSGFLIVWNHLEYRFWLKIHKMKTVVQAIHTDDSNSPDQNKIFSSQTNQVGLLHTQYLVYKWIR